MDWPESYAFENLEVVPNRDTGQLLRGKARFVVPFCAKASPKIRYAAKVLGAPPDWHKPLARMIHAVRIVFSMDENAREWRFLKRYENDADVGVFLPKPIAKGKVDGKSAILVEEIFWKGKSTILGHFISDASDQQRREINLWLTRIESVFSKKNTSYAMTSVREILECRIAMELFLLLSLTDLETTI